MFHNAQQKQMADANKLSTAHVAMQINNIELEIQHKQARRACMLTEELK